MSVSDSLKILLGVDATGVRAGMAQAESVIRHGVGNIVSNILKPLNEAFSIGGAVAAYLGKADALGLLAQRLGMDVGEIDAWSSAVEAAGGSAAAFQRTLATFDASMRDAATRGGKVEWLLSLGIRATDAQGKLRHLTDILPELADRVRGMSAQRSAFLLEKLGLDEGTVRLVRKGGDAVRELVGEMSGYARTKADADAARAFNGAIALLGKATESVAAIIMRAALPAVTALADGARGFIDFLRQHEEYVVAFFALLTAYSTKFLLAWAANPATLGMGLIIAGIAAIAAVIGDLWAYMNGGEAIFADFWARFGTGEELAEKLGRAWDNLKEIGKGVFEGLKEHAENLFRVFEWAVRAGKPLLDLILGLGEKGSPQLRNVGREIANIIAAVVSAIAIIKTVSAVVSGVDMVVKAAGAALPLAVRLGKAFGTITGAVRAFTLAVMSNPIIAILAVLIGLAILIAAHWDEIKAKFNEWGEAAVRWIDDVKTKAAAMWEDFKKKIPTWADVKAKFVEMGTGVRNYFSNLFSDLWKSLLSSMPEWAKKAFGIEGAEGAKEKAKVSPADASSPLHDEVFGSYGMGVPNPVASPADASSPLHDEVFGSYGMGVPNPVASPASPASPTSPTSIDVMPIIRPMGYDAPLQAVAEAMRQNKGGGQQGERGDSTVTIGTITVNSQATDALGVAQDAAAAFQSAWGSLPASAQTGVWQKW